ncbi:hypothetical protein COU77_02695 [Candidatus Peregrinibacteria bacterium CG10_big_fil_rev_8_21_14_0_10_49_16]|nr:MAG: hypothetical protein COW95_02205 [Candidatus Peregrinibacteria bacterium CG22_combo_CG10-13_8_21_14_all_49_11]PIR51948.1 MAG: hypothetical protein COU77_02695 [Candidatus Peregrinibacteria bacterium CG10_big_fil_rev_8_21_14_0_10_49_16]
MEEQIFKILERNKRVEMEKAWETSLTRRGIIAGITYITACVFLWQIGIEGFYLSALVPTGGYTISTLSLPWVRRMWAELKSKAEKTRKR